MRRGTERPRRVQLRKHRYLLHLALLSAQNTAIYRTCCFCTLKTLLFIALGASERSKSLLKAALGASERSKSLLQPALGASERSKSLLKPARRPHERSKSLLKPAPKPQKRSKSLLKPAPAPQKRLRTAAQACFKATVALKITGRALLLKVTARRCWSL